MIKVGKYEIDLSYLGLVLFLICTLVNTSHFGASLSWMIVPCLLIFAGIFCGNRYIEKKACLIFLFLIFSMISTVLSHYVTIQRDTITFAFFCLVYVLAVSHKYTIKQIEKLNNIYICVAFLASLNILYNWLTHHYYVEWFKRATFSFLGVYKDPNYAMAFIVPAMILCLYKIMFCNYQRSRFVYLLVEIVMMTNFITTGSRASLLTFLLAGLVFFLFKSSLSTSKKIKFVLFAIVIIALGWNIITKVLPAQSIARLLNSTSDSRTDLWKSALLIFYENPIIGGGIGSASEASIALSGNYSHNVYIDILANSGIIGSTSFILFFVINCLQTVKHNAYFVYSIGVAFMLPLFFINGFNTATFYLPLIYMSILSRYCSKNENYVEDIIAANRNVCKEKCS